MSERPRPLRLHYQGRVLRAADPQGRGMRHRELFQAGAELIGEAGLDSDLEVLRLGVDALLALGGPVTIDLGHAGVLAALIEDGRELAQVELALASRDPRALEAVAPELLPLLDLYGGPEILAQAAARLPHAPASFGEALAALARAAQGLLARAPDLRISMDLAERRGLGYYTGLFFQGFVEGAGDAVLMGGRYDGLLGCYGRPEPAVGLALDVDAIVGAPRAHPLRSGVVLALSRGAEARLEAEAERRRHSGERAVLIPEEAARAYAEANGYRAVIRSLSEALTEERLDDT